MQNAALVQFPKPPRAKTPRITNDKSIQSLPVPATGVAEYVDDLTPGLRLRITAKDVRSWSFRYADPKGKMQRLDMGRLHDITLAEAREMVKGYRKQLSANPPVDPKQVRVVKREAITFRELLVKWEELHARINMKRKGKPELERLVAELPDWMDRDAADITPEDVLDKYNAKLQLGYKVSANRLRTYISAV